MSAYDADLASDFVEDPRNANKGTERGKKMLDKSIAELGAGRSILVDKNGVVIAGNKTRQAMVEAGIVKAKVVETDGHEMVVVKRTDLDLSDKSGAARKLAYADNRVAELDLAWNIEIILEDENIDFAPEFAEVKESEPPENKVIDPDSLQTEHTCPRCKFEF